MHKTMALLLCMNEVECDKNKFDNVYYSVELSEMVLVLRSDWRNSPDTKRIK